MNFGHPQYFWLLLLVPIFFLFSRLARQAKQRRWRALVDETLLASLSPRLPLAQRRSALHPYWCLAVLFLLLLSLLRPQWGYTWRESSKTGVDIVAAVDVSESMLAQDVRPSRLERARRKVSDLLQKTKGDRLALVAFAGVAFTETPLTLDYGALRNFIAALNPNLIPIRGTNIEAALRESIRALEKGQNIDAERQKSSRAQAIVIFTDGEEFDGDIEAAAEEAAKRDIRIYILGIGSEEGAPIPTPSGYKKDKEGRVIISKYQPQALEKLAARSKGVYVRSVGSDEDLEAIYRLGIEQQLHKGALKGGRAKRYNEYFQLPLFFAILLMLLGPWGKVLSLRKVV